MDKEQIDYRTRAFVNEMAAYETPALSDYDLVRRGALMKMVGDLIDAAKRVVMYEWPEVTFMTESDVSGCEYEGVRKYPHTVRMLLAMTNTPYPRNRKAIPYLKKKIDTFREKAKLAQAEWA